MKVHLLCSEPMLPLLGVFQTPSVSAALLHNAPADVLHQRPPATAALLHQALSLLDALLAMGSFGGVYSSLPSSPFPHHLLLRVEIGYLALLLAVGRRGGVYASFSPFSPHRPLWVKIILLI